MARVFYQALAFLTFLIGPQALAASGITYHGRLLKPDNTPVTASNVQFKMQIRTPGTEDCLLYEEIQTLDLSTTSGVFSLSLGDGSGTRTDSYALNWDLFKALSNRRSFTFSPSDCTGSNTYTPNVTDNRKFKVSFNVGSGWEFLPVQAINYIPMSIETYAVGGFPASALFRVEDAGTLGSVAALTTTQYNNLVSLADGSSSVYEKSGSLNGSTLPSIGSGESVKWNGTSWESYSPLESGDETDPTVETFAKTSLPTCTTGQALISDGTTLSCVSVASGTLTESDVPKLTSAGNGVDGGAISGTIGGSTSINTSGDITTTGNLSVSGSVTTGSFSTRLFDLYDSDNSDKISFLAPATGDLTSDYSLTFPVDAGTSGQVLSTDGSGTLSWISPSTGSVTSVTGTSPIVITGTANAPVVTLSNSGVGAATYGSATQVPVFEVDEKGLIQSVTNTTISGVSPMGSTLSTGKAWIGDVSGDAQEAYINVGNLKKSDGTPQIPSTCTASQTMTWSSVTDVFLCSDIGIEVAQISDFPTLGTAAAKDFGTSAGNLVELDSGGKIPSSLLPSGTSQWTTSGTDIYYNSGNVGIGSSTPGSALDVVGEIRSSARIVSALGFISYGNSGAAYAVSSGSDAAPGASGAATARISLTNTQSLDNGAAYNFMAVRNTATNVQRSYIAAVATTGAGVYTPSIVFGQQTGPTAYNERMRIDQNGNVGIGTTTPNTRLTVEGAMSFSQLTSDPVGAAGYGSLFVKNDGSLYYRDGTGTVTDLLAGGGSGVTSLNGETGSTQSFAVGTTGTEPTWSSGSDTHTLHIPMADQASVTAGLISKTQFDDFDSKQDALGFTPLDPANNLSELTTTASTARTNLGLGTAATKDTGTTDGTIPLIGVGDKLPSSIIPAIDGADITNTPAGNIAATTLQDAIDELDTEKVKISGDTMTGTLNLPSNGLVVGTNQLVTTGGKVGIGTSAPEGPLHISSSANVLSFMDSYTGSTGVGDAWIMRAARGTAGAPTAVQSGDRIGFWGARGYGDTGFSAASQASVQAIAAENYTDAAMGTHLTFETASVGSVVRTERMRITADGKVGIRTTEPSSGLHVYSTVGGANSDWFDPSNYATTLHQNANGINKNGLLVSNRWRASTSYVFAVDGRYTIGGGTIAEDTHNPYLIVRGDGKVGIGTTDPVAKLDVEGAVKVDSSWEGAATTVNSTAAYTIPNISRNVRRITLTANTTLTLPPTTGLAVDQAYTLTVRITQDATGNRNLSWNGNGKTIRWDGGVAPAHSKTANHITIYQFFHIGGENDWFGSMVWRED